MRRNRGRRFDEGPKLNIKKVIATIIALIVIIMVIASIILTLNKKAQEQLNIEVPLEYFSAYSGKEWKVINSKGEQLSNITSEDMIIVPDSTKPVFIVNYETDYQNGESKTKAVNEKNETLFTNYQNVNAIVNYSSVDEVWYNSDVLSYQNNGKYGLIDFTGAEVLPAEYDEIISLKGILKILLIKKDGKYGLYNTLAKTLTVNPMYTEIEPFGQTYNDGYIVKDENGKYGLLGSEGKVILENQYDEIKKGTGSSDKFVITEGLKKKLISKEGNTLLETGFDEILSINANNLIIKNAGKCGIITTTGDIIIEPAFDTIKHCFDDYYIVSNAGKYGVINTAKESVIEMQYEKIEYRSDIVSFICENANYKTDIYTRDFKYVLTGTINKVNTENGYIRIRIDDEYKYYNFQYQEINSKDALKNNTLFLVKENGKYGYVNKDNQKVVECIYDDALEQNKFGFCAVNKDGKWGVLNPNGSVLMEPTKVLTDNVYIDFIGAWHLSENIELNAYTL